jgi:hypothetical protein
MKVKFEEKTYETYFNTELDSQTEIFFPLGQVQEGFLGFDSAARSHNRLFWERLGFPYIHFPYFEGAPLSEIERYMGRIITELPSFKVNLLFQFKRPEYIRLPSGTEWGHWNQPYYRYDIYQEQQQLLMLIHEEYGNKVLTLYASPAIHDINDLVQIKMNRQIIEFSNFQQCQILDGHHRNTYIQAGLNSVACSDPEKIEKVDLLALLNQFENNTSKEEDNRTFIINFRRQIERIMNDDNYYGRAFKNIVSESNENNDRYPLIQSFRMMQRFKELTGIQWLIKI